MTVIQFPHPGRERPGSDWAKVDDDHARRFMQATGFARKDASDQSDIKGPLQLWGEWEADATLLATQNQPPPGHPQYLWSPVVRPRSSYVGLHNTDPFVFDGPFLYSNCRQGQGGGILRNLQRGDLLLFGSKSGNDFVLDTAFVVGKVHGRFNAASAKEACKSLHLHPSRGAADSFIHATASPIEASVIRPGCAPPPNPCGAGATYVLYEGATAKEPVDGMFSFAPAAPATKDFRGFARPAIRLHDINPYCYRRYKILRGVVAKEAWKDVVEQVCRGGLLLGWCFTIDASTGR